LSFLRITFIGSLVLIITLSVTALFKRGFFSSKSKPVKEVSSSFKPAPPPIVALPPASATLIEERNLPLAPIEDHVPEIDRIDLLFTTGIKKLPIVETVKYTSRVPWIKGRPAWIADYATYYATSRHFIARSLNGCHDYFSQKVTPQSYFNVFRKDKNFNFYLLIDLSRCRMWFYYIDLDSNERVLLKTYRVGVGRLDSNAPSGCLTPTGKYLLGHKIAIYKPGITGFFQDRKMEMIRIFGTRWLPFERELGDCVAPAKGFGLHGAPWIDDSKTGTLVENRDCICKYDSDGCVRLALEDIEEVFAIVVTKPTIIDIVKDYTQAKLPGKEVAFPTR